MSATELINELKRISIKAEHKELGHIRCITSEAAEMLRQQQAEIEALKADNKRLKGFCWETDEAKEFLEAVRKAQAE